MPFDIAKFMTEFSSADWDRRWAMLDEIFAHIREQDAELTRLRETVREQQDGIDRFVKVLQRVLLDRLDLQETHRILNDRVREQDAALAEAREICERYAPMETNGGSHAKWLIAHPAPKETP
jgi:hypothetical protein